MASGHPTAASQVLKKFSYKLMTAISAGDPVKLAWKFHSNDLVESVTIEEINLATNTPTAKSSIIVAAVGRKVAADLSFFYKFTALLQEEDDLELLGKELQEAYDQFQSHTNQPPTSIQSPVLNNYAECLRAVYTRTELPVYSKWPPSPSKKFINLAIISKEGITEEEADEFTKATLHGHVDQILKRKGPIQFDKILRAEHDEKLTCILIEGAPGIGKSTLAWQICTKWGRRELFQEYSIILLVRLRDDWVHKAKQVTDLFCHPDDDTQKEVAKKINSLYGKGILIILEGLDELPTHLLTEPTIFTKLLSGNALPQATILVTSRPSATDKLWNWNQQITRHIEIIGFTEKNISEYARSVFPEHELSNFNNYLSIHPHIRPMLYVPLYCAIATIVYSQCHKSHSPPPRTLTELYTRLTQTILIRYLNDHSEYKEGDFTLDPLSNLPTPVYDDFRSLCRLAFEGVTEQQHIFHRQPNTVNHLGFMDAVPELYLQQQSASYSYNFLHLSVQEYLAAYHISLMTTSEQEKLLGTAKYVDFHFNMTRFLAGITHFKDLNKTIVRKTIGISQSINTSTLELLYECQDLTILDGSATYKLQIAWASMSEFQSLGYCIANSKSKWKLEFIRLQNIDAEPFYHELKGCYQNYSIKSMVHCDLEFTRRLLRLQTEQVVLPHIETFTLNCQKMSLPTYLLELIPRMERLNTLELENVLDTSLTELMRVLFRVSTLRRLILPEMNSEGIDLLCQWLPTCQLEEFQVGTNASEEEMLVRLWREVIHIKAIRFLNCTSEFINQVMLQFQASLEHVGSMTISTRHTLSMKSTERVKQLPLQPLPPCLPKIIPRMERLQYLTLDNVPAADTSLTELIPALSKVPTLKDLTLPELNSKGFALLHQWLPTSQLKTLTIGSLTITLLSSRGVNHIATIEFSCSPIEFVNQVMPQLILSSLDNVESLRISTESPQSLPPCLPELIPRMETLHSLTLENVLDTSLTELIPVLSKVRTLRNLTLHELNSKGIALLCQWLPTCQLMTHKIGYLTITLIPSWEINTEGTIEFIQSTTEFVNQVMSQLSSVDNVESLRISTESLQPLAPCLPELIPRMKILHTLVLDNVLDTSLTKLIPALYKVHTLRNLKLCKLNLEGIVHLCQWLPTCQLERLTAGTSTCTGYSSDVKMTFNRNHIIDTIEFTSSATELIRQVISPLQESLVHVKSMSIKQQDAKPLPPCLLELIPRMERLNALELENVTSLTELTPILSKVPTLKKLTLPKSNSENTALLCQWLPKSQLEKLTIGTRSCNIILKPSKETECIISMAFRECTTEFIDQIISQLQESLVHLESMTISNEFYLQLQPLPPSLLKLIPRMERLNKLTLMSVLDISWTALMPVIFRVPTLRNLTLHDLNSDDSALFCQQLHLSHLEELTVGRQCFIVLKRSKETNYISTIAFKEPCTTNFIVQVVPQLQASFVHAESMIISFGHQQPLPSCLLELIPRMERLNTLKLERVLDTSLTELIPVLTRVPTLRNLTLPELNPKGIALLCQWLPKSQLEKLTGAMFCSNTINITLKQSTETNCISTIDFRDCAAEFIDLVMSQLRTVHIETLKIPGGSLLTIRCGSGLLVQPQPLPSCLLSLIPGMERLNTLELERALDISLTELIPVLSRVSTLRNLTLAVPELNSEGIALLCQWLPKSQLEKLKILDRSYILATITLKQSKEINYVSTMDIGRYATQEFFDQFLSQLRTSYMTLSSQSVAVQQGNTAAVLGSSTPL